MIEFTAQDVVFELADITVAFVHNYKGSQWPGLMVSYKDSDGGSCVVRAPLTVMHAVQLCSFSFTSLVKKLESQDILIEELREKLASEGKAGDVIPFKPKVH